MSDAVQIALVIAVAVVIVVLLLRGSLSSLRIKADQKSVEGEVKTHAQGPTPEGGVVIRGNVQAGTGQEISVRRGDAEVSDNRQLGKNQKIDVGS